MPPPTSAPVSNRGRTLPELSGGPWELDPLQANLGTERRLPIRRGDDRVTTFLDQIRIPLEKDGDPFRFDPRELRGRPPGGLHHRLEVIPSVLRKRAGQRLTGRGVVGLEGAEHGCRLNPGAIDQNRARTHGCAPKKKGRALPDP